jgi:hypothetical protein
VVTPAADAPELVSWLNREMLAASCEQVVKNSVFRRACLGKTEHGSFTPARIWSGSGVSAAKGIFLAIPAYF